MDLALDQLTGDLYLDGGDIATVDGADAIAQSLAIRLGFYRGEWRLDARIGVPYFEKILVKNPRLSEVEALLRQTILTTPGVTGIERFDLEYSPGARTARLSFSASSTSGPVVFDRELILGAPA